MIMNNYLCMDVGPVVLEHTRGYLTDIRNIDNRNTTL
jgi:hypothetical protein